MGFTQEDVSRRIGVSIRHYKSLEAGKSNGSMDVWMHLKRLFGKTIDFLCEGEKKIDRKRA